MLSVSLSVYLHQRNLLETYIKNLFLFSSPNLLLVCLLQSQTVHKIGVGVYKVFNSTILLVKRLILPIYKSY